MDTSGYDQSSGSLHGHNKTFAFRLELALLTSEFFSASRQSACKSIMQSRSCVFASLDISKLLITSCKMQIDFIKPYHFLRIGSCKTNCQFLKIAIAKNSLQYQQRQCCQGGKVSRNFFPRLVNLYLSYSFGITTVDFQSSDNDCGDFKLS